MDEDGAGLDSMDGHILQRSVAVRVAQRSGERERGKGQIRLHHLKPKEGGWTLTTARQRPSLMAAVALVSPRRDPIEWRQAKLGQGGCTRVS